jgi:cell division protein FtsL
LKSASIRSITARPTRSAYAPWPTKPTSTGSVSVSAQASTNSKRPLPSKAATPAVSWSVLVPTISCMALLILLVLSQKAQLVSAQYRLVELKGQQVALLKSQSELKLRLQNLSSLDRVDSLARKKLHMIAPTERLVLDLGTPSVARQSSGTVGYNMGASSTAAGFSVGSY